MQLYAAHPPKSLVYTSMRIKVHYLCTAGNRITELEGLTPQNLPSLRTLDLHSNALTSTVGIQLPALQKLYLASNRLAKLEGLEGLRQLTTLHLRANRITSCDGFAPSMEALQYLNFRSVGTLPHRLPSTAFDLLGLSF